MIKFSIGSFSFHRLLGDGKQDIFQYIKDCKDLGCTHLQPWNAHFARSTSKEEVNKLGRNPGLPGMPTWCLPPDDDAYIADIRAAADDAGLPFECIAVDRAHIFEPTEAQRNENRKLACLWLEVAEKLGAESMRVDAGGPQDMPDDVFKIICEGYADLIERGFDCGVRIITENHWGPSVVPENVVKLLENIDGLGFLFDTNNWLKERQDEAWDMCAKYAVATHFKTFEFDEEGEEKNVDVRRAVELLVEAGYDGPWGVESVPSDGDEIGAAAKTIALIRRSLDDLGVR
ncbi:MAG TPA: TIM barrel protein [Candidatus Brocadiia bacterium]|nr:TIM barrel protein [Candidatus Brocadiia bacterium]